MQKRVQIIVTGRVQGVSYRAATQKTANHLGIVGWVRNKADGSVEILAEGHPDQLQQFQAWCAKGPLWARVEKLAISEVPYAEPYTCFEIVRDA